MDVDFEVFKLDNLNKNHALIIIAVLLVGVGISALAYSQTQVKEQTESYSTYATVNESEGRNITAGIDTGGGLAFGELVEGTNMTKTLELSSEKLTLAEMSSTGNISEGLEYKDQLFINDTEIPVKYVGSEPGHYEGEILLDLKTAQNWWGEKWLELLYQLP